jgi:proteasome alpha subunit
MTAYKADSIGANKKEVDEYLESKYDEKMPLDDAIRLCVESLRKTQEEKLMQENVEISYATQKTKKVVSLPDKEVGKYLKSSS